MKPERSIVVTTLEEQDLAEQASDRKTTAAERFAAVEHLREGYFALHGRPDPGLARVLVVVDFPPRDKDLADLALLGAPPRVPPRRTRKR